MQVLRDLLTSPNAEFTSEKANLAMIGFTDTTSCSAPYEIISNNFFSERISHSATEYESECIRLHTEESAYPFYFLSNFSIGTIDANVFIHRFKEKCSTAVYSGSQYDIVIAFPAAQYFTEGPSDEVWTVSSWSINAPVECEGLDNHNMPDFKYGLNELLNSFKNAVPLSRSDRLFEMAEKVASQINENKEADLDKWVDTLSDDLSKLTD